MTKHQGKTGNPAITVAKVADPEQLKMAQKIRYDVFVIGQRVPEEEEIDQYEDDCTHFLAYMDGTPCGAARWRFTDEGAKLERFAVLQDFRGLGVGSALVASVMDDIEKHLDFNGNFYLNAQLSAIPLYAKFGFEKVGPMFQECDIDHYKMVKNQP